MSRDEAYHKAEQKIEETQRNGATMLDLRCPYDVDESGKLTNLNESLVIGSQAIRAGGMILVC